MLFKKYLKVSDLSTVNKSSENHKPWLPKYFVEYIDITIKQATENIIPFLISLVCEAPINIPSNW